MSSQERPVSGRHWRFGVCEYAEVSRTLAVNGKAIEIEAKPLDLLLQLLETPTQVVSKEHLLNTVWDVETTEYSVTTAVGKLRKAFGGPRQSVILNVAGIGYRMAVPVVCAVEEQGSSALEIHPGDPIPLRTHWRAIQKLSENDRSPVWLAQHEQTQEKRVYKFALDGIRLRALQQEVMVFRLLTKGLGERASFVVRILDWNFETEPFFIESEYCGANLLETSAGEAFRITTLEQRVQIAAEIATAVSAAHSLAVLHNDLKPANILMAQDPDSAPETVQAPNPPADRSLDQPPEVRWSLKIADFGAASLENLELLRSLNISVPEAFDGRGAGVGALAGTLMYSAPELLLGGAPTVFSDVYAVGVMLYQLASGNFHEPPLPGWEQKIADPILRRDISDAANVNPAERIRSMAELAVRLQTFAARREEERRQARAKVEAAATQAALARTRMRRPWVILAMTSLLVALVLTLGAAIHAIRDRNAERKRVATLESMYDFVAIDLLGQSNPYQDSGGSSNPKQSLVDAIAAASSRIDIRFAHEAEMAGRLHETVADTYRTRTRYEAADQEYASAARRFRELDGPLSERAAVAELKREFTAIAAQLPGWQPAAREGFAQQEKVIARLRHPSAELQAWETVVHVALLGMGAHPEEALPLLTAAVERARATPGFSPALLVRLEDQFCGTYTRLGDGKNLERVSRDIIDVLSKQHSKDSPILFPYDMYLEEAFYLQAKYPEVIAQADENMARFRRVLGERHQLTLATLATRAAAEGQMERYAEAERDDLALYAAEQQNPSGKRMEEGSLVDAAIYECHRGAFAEGIQHARTVMRETGPGPAAQPAFYNGSMFAIAECLLGEQEAGTRGNRAADLTQVESLLNSVDTGLIAETSDGSATAGAREVALARLALLQGHPDIARTAAAAAAPLLIGKPGTDPFEMRQLQRVQGELARNSR